MRRYKVLVSENAHHADPDHPPREAGVFGTDEEAQAHCRVIHERSRDEDGAAWGMFGEHAWVVPMEVDTPAPPPPAREDARADRAAGFGPSPAPDAELLHGAIRDEARPAGGDVEAALARALDGATAEGRWDLVSAILSELSARR